MNNSIILAVNHIGCDIECKLKLKEYKCLDSYLKYQEYCKINNYSKNLLGEILIIDDNNYKIILLFCKDKNKIDEESFKECASILKNKLNINISLDDLK